MSTPLEAKVSVLHYIADFSKEEGALDFKIYPVDTDVVSLKCIIPGLSDTIWQGGEFVLQLNFPNDFPENPPQAKFITAIYHPNIAKDGSINLDILNPGQWDKETTLMKILRSAQTILNEPNKESVVNTEANNEYLKYKEDNSNDEYVKKVKECVEQSKQTSKTEISATNKPSGTSFGGSKNSTGATFSFNAKSTNEPSKAGKFSFGGNKLPSSQTKPTNLTFSGPKSTNGSNDGPKPFSFNFSKPATTNEENRPKFSFSGNKSSDEQNNAPKLSFNKAISSDEQSKGFNFSFNKAKLSNEESNAPKFSFNETKSSNEENRPKFSFSGNKLSDEQNNAPKLSFNKAISSDEQSKGFKVSFNKAKLSNEESNAPKISLNETKSSDEQNNEPKLSFNKDKSSDEQSKGFKFSFNKAKLSNEESNAPKFSLNETKSSDEQNNAPKLSLNKAKSSDEENRPKFSFGGLKSSDEQNNGPKLSFNKAKSSDEESKTPKFSFNETKSSDEQNNAPKLSFNKAKSSDEENRPKFSFGGHKSSDEQNNGPKLSFNKAKSSDEESKTPKFSFNETKSSDEQNNAPKLSFKLHHQNDESKPAQIIKTDHSQEPPEIKIEPRSIEPTPEEIKSDTQATTTQKSMPKYTLKSKMTVKIVNDDMIPDKISKNQYVMLNEANLAIVEESSKMHNKQSLLENVALFKKYLQDIKIRINQSFEFAELISTEMIIFDMNEENLNDYVAATKAILASRPYSYKPPLSMVKQLVRALINAFFTRINDHEIIFKFIKQLDSDDVECYLHCQIKRQIKIITEDEMKQKAFTNKSIEIPAFLNNIIAKLDKTKTGTNKTVEVEEKTKIAQAIINDDLNSLQKALDEKEPIDYLKFKVEMNSNERRILPKKKHPRQGYKQEKTNDPTLLEYAAFHASEKCFNYLYNQKKCKITKNMTKYALCGGNENICNTISKDGKSFLEDLELAIKFHQPKLFKKYFLEYYTHYNGNEKFSYERIIKKYTTSCIKFFSFRCLRFLIEFGADITDCMINEALKRDIHSLFIFLMQLNVDINKQDKSDFAAIHCAIRAGNLTAIQIMLANSPKHPLDLNLGDHCGRTPIHFAAIVGNIEIFNLLAKQPNVDLTRLDDEEMSPLHYAARQGNYDVCKRLLDVDKINPNCRNSAYMSPLHYACINGRLDIAKLLLGNPLTEVNLHDIGGWAPIHYAIDNLNVQLVSVLLQHEKINPNVIDSVFIYIIFFIQFLFFNILMIQPL